MGCLRSRRAEIFDYWNTLGILKVKDFSATPISGKIAIYGWALFSYPNLKPFLQTFTIFKPEFNIRQQGIVEMPFGCGYIG